MHEVTSDVLEVLFSVPGDDRLRGMRLDRAVLDAVPGRLMHSSMDELAFDVVAMGICEPRRIEDFTAADGSGVRWLPLSDWLQDIS